MIRLANHPIKRPTPQEELEQQYIEAKQLSANHKWAAALNLCNGILTVQQNKLGKDHLDCGKTFERYWRCLDANGRELPSVHCIEGSIAYPKGTLEVDALELIETSIYIDALMEKVNETEEEAAKR